MSVFTVVKQNPIVFPLASLAVMAILAVSETSYWRSLSSISNLTEVGAARAHVQTLAQGMLDAESGQRGYLLTNRKEYLLPYERALRNINESFKFLDQYYSKDASSMAILGKLHAVVDGKLSELSETNRLYDEGKIDAATQLVLSDIGKEKMEAVRQLTADLVARETGNVNATRSDIEQTLWLSRCGVALLSLLSLLSLFMFLRQRATLEAQRDEQQRLVRGERDRLEREVEERTAQLTELTAYLQTAREDERHRLARNLHDDLGALLTSAKLDAARIRPRLVGTAPEALERLNHLVDTLNSSIAMGRRIIEDLRPSTLGNLGLIPTLEILARDFSHNSGIAIHCELKPVKLLSDSELVIYRLVQESFTNIAKYAQAKNVWIELASRNGRAEVRVRDDGVGFNTTAQPRSAFGLVGMRFRVKSVGGALRLVSAPGQGTTIEVSLPEANRAAA